jgi:DNA (cytosine-5)-methyltransferase 1
MIHDVNPDIVSMENVPNLQNQSIYHDFVKTLEKKGYQIDSKLVYCPDYGIAQTRKRLVLLASKLGDIKLIPKTHSPENYVSVEKIIKHI